MSVNIVRRSPLAIRTTTAVAALALLAGPVAAAGAQPAPAGPDEAPPTAGNTVADPLEDRVVFEVLYVTSGTRASEGEYPYPPYTAVVDPEISAAATAQARRLAADAAAGIPVEQGVRAVNTIVTGWPHQREIVARGEAGYRAENHYEAGLYGPTPTEGGPVDPRFALMAGPKTHTAVGAARIPGTAELVVVVVNGYATEPAGPYAAPAGGDAGDHGWPVDRDADWIPHAESAAGALGSLAG